MLLRDLFHSYFYICCTDGAPTHIQFDGGLTPADTYRQKKNHTNILNLWRIIIRAHKIYGNSFIIKNAFYANTLCRYI